MAPSEVKKLQEIAMAHGGSLTLNPDTGLPEAGFLKDVFKAVAPMALGAVLGPAGFGLSTIMAGVATGGITALATGSLSRGLMAGLGAYGGAGLGESLMGAGTGAMAASDLAAQQAAGSFPTLAEGASAEQIAKYTTDVGAARTAALSKAGSAGFMDRASAGLGQMASNPGMYGKDLLQFGGAAAASAMPTTTTQMPTTPQSDAYVRPKRFDRFSQTYEDLAPVKASEFGSRGFAGGGIVALAEGGGVPIAAPRMTMEQLRNNYAASGGKSGYTPYIPPTMEAFNTKYTNTGGSKQAYDYLMGKGVSTLVPYTPTGEIAKPYGEAVMGMPVNTNTKYIYDPVTRTYKLNPNYQEPKTATEKAAAKPAEKAVAEKAAAEAIAKAGGAASGAGGGDSGGGGGGGYDYSNFAPSYEGDPNSLTNGLISALIGRQDPTNVPVSDYSTYSPGYVSEQNDLDQQYSMGNPNTMGYSPGEIAAMQAQDAAYSMGNPDTLGYSPGEIAAMQDQDAAYSMGNPGESAAENTGYTGTSSETGVGNPGESYGGYGGTSSDTGIGNPGESYGGGGIIPVGYAMGGLGSLGGYSDGGRLLKGPGDGVSDSIPATIRGPTGKQPARLADGEFVVPARIVSELGNGSTEAGARKLYAMMDRIQANRKKSVGKDKVAVNSRAEKHLPA